MLRYFIRNIDFKVCKLGGVKLTILNPSIFQSGLSFTNLTFLRVLKPQLFGVLLSIDIGVSVNSLLTTMSIDNKMPNGLS